MIEDIEGATPERGRRSHMLALSLATAGGAVVLFLALVLAPLEIDPLPQASRPQPRTSAAPVTNALPRAPILNTVDQARQRVCSYGAGTQWIVVSGLSIDGRPGRLPSVRAPLEPTSGPIAGQPASAVWMTVSCSPAEVLPPSVDLRSIAR